MIAPRVNEDNVLLAERTRANGFGHLCIIGVAALTTNIADAERWDTLFAGMIVVLSLFRLGMPRPRLTDTVVRARRWRITFAVATVLTGWSWAMLSAIQIYHLGALDQSSVFLLVATAGISASGASSLSSWRRLSVLFVLSCLAPVVITLAIFDAVQYLPVLLVVTVYQVFLVIQVRANWRTLESLRERESQYRTLVNATLECVVIHRNGIILEVNPATERTFGYSARELVGTQILNLVHPEDVEENIRQMTKDTGERRETRAIRRDGSTIFIEVRATGFIYRGEAARVTCLQDISEKRRADASLRETSEQRQRLAEDRESAALESLRIKSEFLATMSHEIRTPLNAIIGLTDLLNDTTDVEVRRRYLRTLKSSGEGLLHLVNDVLDFSKMDTGALVLEDAPFGVTSLIEDQCDLIAARARAKNLAFVTDIDPSLPQTVRGDAGRLGQVCLNLLANAIKFTDVGVVKVKCFEIARAEGRVRFRFEVIDTGVGIPDDIVGRLFRPFSQADSSSSRKFGGTGLGLTICKRLVEAMGGEIGFESVANVGTRFWFEVPLGIEDQRPAAAPVAGSVPADLRLIIIGDHFAHGEVVAKCARAWSLHADHRALHELADPAATPGPHELVIASASQLTAADVTRLGARGARVLLVGTDGRPGEPAPADGARVRVVPTPLRHADLLRAVADFAPTPAAPAPAAVSAPMFAPARVLVVEDNSTNQMLILAVLSRLGLQAQAVVNGVEALAALRDQTYDLILMDCQMPEMDGYEATRRIRAREVVDGGHIPIVALTANVMPEDRARCEECGMDAFVPKPLKRDKLVAELIKYLKITGGAGEQSA